MVKRKTKGEAILCVYLGGIFPDPDDVSTGCALFCHYQAPADSGDLISMTIPFVELHYVARVLGTAGVNRSWRNLEYWKLPKRERELVDGIEDTLQPVIGPMKAFDIDRMRGSNSVH